MPDNLLCTNTHLNTESDADGSTEQQQDPCNILYIEYASDWKSSNCARLESE